MAKLSIYYYSGTGNSLLVARKLAASIEGARLLPLAALAGEERRREEGEALGFVFPVNFLALPKIFADYLATSNFGKAEYFFAIATNGGDAGNSLHDLDGILRAKGKRLNYGADLPMGDNSIVVRTSAGTLARRMAALDARLGILSGAIANREESGALRGKAFATALGKMYDFAFDRYYHSSRGHADPAACSACGQCARICPVSNIRLESGRALWDDHCARCFGCINFCPRNAVYLGRIHPATKEAQHRCPGIDAVDLYRA